MCKAVKEDKNVVSIRGEDHSSPGPKTSINNLIGPIKLQIWPFGNVKIDRMPIVFWHGGNVYSATDFNDYEDVLSILAQLGLTVKNCVYVHTKFMIFTEEVRGWFKNNN